MEGFPGVDLVGAVTPPNDFTHASVSWNQSVLLQDGATHPGTYIKPVVPGP
jgi:hypothetical protein